MHDQVYEIYHLPLQEPNNDSGLDNASLQDDCYIKLVRVRLRMARPQTRSPELCTTVVHVSVCTSVI